MDNIIYNYIYIYNSGLVGLFVCCGGPKPLELFADNIALMNIWCGSTSVPLKVFTFAAGTDPHSFLNSFQKKRYK